MDDNTPLQDFGADTEVAAPPAAPPAEPSGDEGEQTAQPVEASGSEEQQAQPDESKDNPIAEPKESGRPEKKDRLQSRFGELTGTIKQQQDYITQLEATYQRQQAMAGVKPLTPNEDGYIDPQALQAQQTQIAQAAAQSEGAILRQELERERIANRFDSEAKEVVGTYKVLDPNAAEYNEAVAKAAEEYVQTAINPNVNNLNVLKTLSPKKMIDNYMKALESYGRNAQSVSAENLQNIAASQGVTPDSAATPADPNSEDELTKRVANIKF